MCVRYENGIVPIPVTIAVQPSLANRSHIARSHTLREVTHCEKSRPDICWLRYNHATLRHLSQPEWSRTISVTTRKHNITSTPSWLSAIRCRPFAVSRFPSPCNCVLLVHPFQFWNRNFDKGKVQQYLCVSKTFVFGYFANPQYIIPNVLATRPAVAWAVNLNALRALDIDHRTLQKLIGAT